MTHSCPLYRTFCDVLSESYIIVKHKDLVTIFADDTCVVSLGMPVQTKCALHLLYMNTDMSVMDGNERFGVCLLWRSTRDACLIVSHGCSLLHLGRLFVL